MNNLVLNISNVQRLPMSNYNSSMSNIDKLN